MLGVATHSSEQRARQLLHHGNPDGRWPVMKYAQRCRATKGKPSCFQRTQQFFPSTGFVCSNIRQDRPQLLSRVWPIVLASPVRYSTSWLSPPRPSTLATPACHGPFLPRGGHSDPKALPGARHHRRRIIAAIPTLVGVLLQHVLRIRRPAIWLPRSPAAETSPPWVLFLLLP